MRKVKNIAAKTAAILLLFFAGTNAVEVHPVFTISFFIIAAAIIYICDDEEVL